jgi:hypothetical protein
MKKFITRRTQPEPVKEETESDNDNDVPKNPNGDFSDQEEELVPIAAKPFLF